MDPLARLLALISYSLLLSSSAAFTSKNKPRIVFTAFNIHNARFPSVTTEDCCYTMAPNDGGILNRLSPADVSLEIKDPVDSKALEQATTILKELLETKGSMTVNGERLVNVAKRLGDVDASVSSVPDLIVSKDVCKQAFDELSEKDRTTLVNIHGRIRAFAEMQRKSIVDMEMDIPGGKAGHNVSPCEGSCFECVGQ
jgi:hypothetical protein